MGITTAVKSPFSPNDGYLYISTGDITALNPAQDPSSLLGKILRLDVESGVEPYAIPPTNPLLGQPDARGEIWALGLRNPWRFSFDRATGDLYIGDVGELEWEEVDFQPAASTGGENYGWKPMEGTHCYPEGSQCDPTGFTPPVWEYNHTVGCSVTGGFVYRGSEFALMEGVYFYADYCGGQVWGLRQDGGEWQNQELADTDFFITSFGEDEAGELYLADYGSGTVYRLVDLESSDTVVEVSNFEFAPYTSTIQTGETVSWNNVQGFHDIQADDGSFSSGPPAAAPWLYSHTFAEAGTYAYYCSIHGGPGGEGMSGVVVVEPEVLPTMRVERMVIRGRPFGEQNRVMGYALVKDGEGNPVANAAVEARWRLPDGTIVTKQSLTSPEGVVPFSTIGPDGVYTLQLLSVVKAGLTFDAENSILIKRAVIQ